MPIENRKGLRVVSSDTTMRELWGIPLTITLARQDMAPLFYKARQDAQGDEENADFWQSNAPGAGPIAIALTQDAAIDVWSDREEYGMKGLPEILAKVFGGDGPLLLINLLLVLEQSQSFLVLVG